MRDMIKVLENETGALRTPPESVPRIAAGRLAVNRRGGRLDGPLRFDSLALRPYRAGGVGASPTRYSSNSK